MLKEVQQTLLYLASVRLELFQNNFIIVRYGHLILKEHLAHDFLCLSKCFGGFLADSSDFLSFFFVPDRIGLAQKSNTHDLSKIARGKCPMVVSPLLLLVRILN